MSTQVLTVFTKDIEGRGKGFISSRKIKAGELICQERAAFVLDTEEINRQTVARELSRLGRDKQREFSDLRSKTGGGEELEVFLNNAINTDSHSDSQQFGLFLKIARINHSCCPNAGEENTATIDGNIISLILSLGEHRGQRGAGGEGSPGDSSRH